MSSDWKICMLGELGTIKTGKTPASSLGDGFGGTVPFVTPGDMNGQKWITDTDRCLNERGLASVSSSLMPPRSVAVSCIGSDMGKASLLSRPSVTNQQINTIAVDESRFNAEFVYYDLSVRQQELKAAASGSATPILNKGHFSAFEISIPPRATQDKIAEILGKLDDRIAVNRRINQTLEAMAQAIFQSWFVDFYPVKAKIAAKAEGRDPLRAAMSAICGKADAELDALPPAQYEQLAATAALFPDELVDSELGKMPKRWHSSTLGEHCAYLNRGISPKYIDEGGVLVLNQKCIRDFRLDPSKARRHDPNQRNVSGRELQQGDVLVNSTGVGTLGRGAQVLRLDEPTIVDSHVTVVRSGPTLNSAYLGRWFVMKQADIEAMGEGSTGQTELARGKLVSMLILVPDQAVLGAFADAVAPIQSLIATRDRESLVLQQTRDALLPRLLSGELQPTVALEGVDA